MIKVLSILVVAMLCMGVESSRSKPNFVIIMTDDQDIVLNGMTPMKKTQKLIAKQGITFTNAFTSSPICCPSRASFLTGAFAHNHRTTNNSAHGGCYGEFWRQLESFATFPTLLKANGYRNFYAGKYLNEFTAKSPVPAGYDAFFGLDGNSKYYDYKLNENGVVKKYKREYLTDVLLQRALSFIDDQTNSTENGPFMMIIAPPAAHAPFIAADKYLDRFPDEKAPRTENFNKQSEDKHWLLTMPPTELSNDTIEKIDEIYRKRWQTLLSVDDLVEGVVKSLDEKGFLKDTYVFYTSDNGYHLGQHGQAWDKRQPYETDIRVPLLVRGPNVPKKAVSNDLVALLDIAPTLLELSDAPSAGNVFDGVSFAASLNKNPKNPVKKRTKLLIEYWGEENDADFTPDCPWTAHDRLMGCEKAASCHCQDSWNNTYSCIRHIEEQHTDYLYCEFKDTENFVEAYNLLEDPHEMTNIGYTEIPSIRAQYQLWIEDMKKCQGQNCVS
ncbi:N-acetylglucosamine-6-sulfatase-like [Culicoides brevitarsis]|uniref:N-acetylglucosamine-6-sulfatase-like n=1 Tax=Culicoides brevitarsis TaxID=469753 RepID=UPI00307C5311